MRHPLAWALTPADVLRLVRTDTHPVALCGAWAGGGDVIAAEPVAVRAAPGPLAEVLDSELGDLSEVGDDLTFGGGWIGYLGYSAGGETLPPTGPRALPAWWFGFYDHVLHRDRATGQWYFEALWTEARADALEERFAELGRRAAPVLAGTVSAADAPGYTLGTFRLLPGAAGHQEAVRKAVEYIHQGDIFQANVTLRAEAEFTGDPLDAFCRGVTALDPPYAAFIGVSALGERRAAVASLSPELFLRRTGDTVTSKPIKGTALRAVDEGEAAAQRVELEASTKNRAENVMIVDLVRNDLSRVCLPGSVTVPVLLGPEPHPGVWHLVSTVTGTLNPGAGDGDLIRATFPPGSVTGAPKVRALEVIDELETTPREAYTGAVGYRSPVSGLELNVAIRTFEFAAGKAWLGAGGGIVADSDPAAEYAECLIKATPLLRALGARLDASAPPVDAGALRRALLPRPAAGVFTTLLVTGGETRGLAAHLARLASSVRALYGKDLPPSLGEDLAACLATRPTGRLRITVRPVGGPLQAKIETVPLGLPSTAPEKTAAGGAVATSPGVAAAATAAGAGITLRPVLLPGGIGAYKYRDRRLLAELATQAKAGPDQHLLLTDETGEVLETDRANVFAVIEGVLLTPPTDGRILPGITRAAVLRAARDHGIRAGRKPLTLEDLTEASEVFVSNAVIGVLPVTAIGNRTWRPGPVTATLAGALATRFLDSPAAAQSAPARRAVPVELHEPSDRHSQSPVSPAAPRRPGPARPVVILIDNYDSFTFNLAHLLATSGAHVEVVRNDEVTASQVVAAAPAGVVISPGPCSPAEAGISIAAVTACAGAGVPLLGICLGHQAIGAAFGAQVVKAPSPVHGKAFPVTHDGHGVLAGLPSPFQATRYHSLIVDEATLPRDVLVTARTDGMLMAISHRIRPVEGVQFHPESILTTHGSEIIANFVGAAVKRSRGVALTFNQS